MSTSTVDARKRIVLPDGKPGDVFDIQKEDDGRLVLVRLEKPRPRRMSRRAALAAMRKAPLRPTMSWDELKVLTREP